MLQTRVGKRTAAAAFRIATQLVDEGLIDLDEALERVTGAQLALLMFPDARRRQAAAPQLAKGMNALPGSGRRCGGLLESNRASSQGDGENAILVRRETNPDDLGGMIAAQGIF